MDLVTWMMRLDRHTRPTIREALQHPFFQLHSEKAPFSAPEGGGGGGGEGEGGGGGGGSPKKKKKKKKKKNATKLRRAGNYVPLKLVGGLGLGREKGRGCGGVWGGFGGIPCFWRCCCFCLFVCVCFFLGGVLGLSCTSFSTVNGRPLDLMGSG